MTKPAPVYILGGAQTDFARNWSKEGKHFVAMMREATLGALEATSIEPKEVETAHVGNFAAELYAKQGHIGAFFIEVDPAFSGLPTSRHEAACASGSIALIAASAEIEAGRYDLSCVVGVEQMKTVDSTTGGDYLGTAAWYEREAKGIEFPFPKLFGRLGDEYDKRYGLKDEHLAHISAVNYSNAKHNPNAQTRNWFMSESHAQQESKDNTYVLPHTRQAILDAFKRAEIASAASLSGIETHDCFTTSEYMAIDHFGITKPGESWKAVEEGVIELGGKLPINPSGGLIGAGHPVGATGVRQTLDAFKQVTRQAGDYQIENAEKIAVMNIGGSGTTSCVFVVGK